MPNMILDDGGNRRCSLPGVRAEGGDEVLDKPGSEKRRSVRSSN
jgi:hypothetical protein